MFLFKLTSNGRLIPRVLIYITVCFYLNTTGLGSKLASTLFTLQYVSI